MQTEVQRKQMRSFGLIVGEVFLIIAFWPIFFSDGTGLRLWALLAGIVLIVSAFIYPGFLKPVFHLWMKVGHVLGWVNTRIILAIGFYGMFVPLGLVMRLMGKDPMSRKFDSKTDSYRVIKSPRQPSHMRRQF